MRVVANEYVHTPILSQHHKSTTWDSDERLEIWYYVRNLSEVLTDSS